MATQPQGNNGQQATLEQKVGQVRELFSDAPDMAKTALENILREVKPDAEMSGGATSAGRIGKRLGAVSELTVIAPFTKGGAQRLRGILKLLNGNFRGAEKVGTVHDMRFVFLDKDTKLLFATAFDGDWDAYIEDFATKIPDYMDILFTAFEGWPGIRSPAIKDWIVKYQLPADAWYVANPGMTVVDTKRALHVMKAVDEFLDKLS